MEEQKKKKKGRHAHQEQLFSIQTGPNRRTKITVKRSCRTIALALFHLSLFWFKTYLVRYSSSSLHRETADFSILSFLGDTHKLAGARWRL